MSVLGHFRRVPGSDDRATDDDIYCAYRLVFRRELDPAGLTLHRRLVADGLSLDRLIRGFSNSDEYRLRQSEEAMPTG